MKHFIFIILLAMAGHSPIVARETFFSSPDPKASKEKGAYITWKTGGDLYRVYESGNVYFHYDKKDSFEFMHKKAKKNVKEIFGLVRSIDFAAAQKDIILDDKPRSYIEFTQNEKTNTVMWENGTPSKDAKLAELLEKLGGIV